MIKMVSLSERDNTKFCTASTFAYDPNNNNINPPKIAAMVFSMIPEIVTANTFDDFIGVLVFF